MERKFIPLSVPNFSGREKELVGQAVVSEWVSTGGSMVAGFEEKIAEYVGMPLAVAANSGTSGLHLAMLCAGLGRGHEVIAPALTFIAAVNPISYVGARPVFIGCDDSLCIDPDAVEEFCENQCEMNENGLVNKTTGAPVKALLVVHVFGNMADMPRLLGIARRYGLVLIEDATEALGTCYTQGPLKGKMAGTMGDVGVYSFNGNKLITTGAGGMLVANRAEWLRRAKHLSTQAKEDELNFVHDEVGYNYRMTNLQAALGVAQLEQIESFIAHKHLLYQFYHQHLHEKHGYSLLPFREGVRSNRWFFSLICRRTGVTRQGIIDHLRDMGIQSRPVWELIHRQKPYLCCEAWRTEKAEYYREHIVNLPCSTNLAPEDAERVARALLEMD